MKMINTVLGKITPEEIGNVLSHEHIICCSHATTVSNVLLPMLRNMGVSEKQINKMMHDNPISLMIKE
jgi:predicted metal-dependent phosphotriesterase family hydrolase